MKKPNKIRREGLAFAISVLVENLPPDAEAQIACVIHAWFQDEKSIVNMAYAINERLKILQTERTDLVDALAVLRKEYSQGETHFPLKG